MESSANIKLSVSIPTFNRSSLLNKALESLLIQTYPTDQFEVIVVDNGSKDDTRSVALGFEKKIPYFRYEFADEPGLHVGRHQGLRVAKADILVFVDDDIEAFPSWLEGIWSSFQENDVTLTGGKNLPKYEIPPPFWIKDMWDRKMEYGNCIGPLSILDFGDEKRDMNPYYFFGCNFSIRKEILLRAGGFHPDSMPQNKVRYRGDGESHVAAYVLNNGYRALYNPKASVYHYVPRERITLEYFCKRAFNQGISDSYTKIRKNFYGSTGR
jgi:glucosyl-dolichyl phosphate glucuronosyltransferase